MADGQGHLACVYALRYGQLQVSESVGIALLPVRRYGIVYHRLYAAVKKMAAQKR